MKLKPAPVNGKFTLTYLEGGGGAADSAPREIFVNNSVILKTNYGSETVI